MTIKDRYLNNPHINLDEKRKKKLGITTEEITSNETPRDGNAVELPNIDPPIWKEVIKRKRKSDKAE